MPPTSFQPTEKTVPRATARIGAPSGAKMSSPWCQPTSPRAAPKVSMNDGGAVHREDVAALCQPRLDGGVGRIGGTAGARGRDVCGGPLAGDFGPGFTVGAGGGGGSGGGGGGARGACTAASA